MATKISSSAAMGSKFKFQFACDSDDEQKQQPLTTRRQAEQKITTAKDGFLKEKGSIRRNNFFHQQEDELEFCRQKRHAIVRLMRSNTQAKPNAAPLKLFEQIIAKDQANEEGQNVAKKKKKAKKHILFQMFGDSSDDKKQQQPKPKQDTSKTSPLKIASEETEQITQNIESGPFQDRDVNFQPRSGKIPQQAPKNNFPDFAAITGQQAEYFEDSRHSELILQPSFLSPEQKKQFVNRPIPNSVKFSGLIRKTNPLSNILYPQYDLFTSQNCAHVLSCKKYFGSLGSNLRMSLDPDGFNKSGKHYLGKLRTGGEAELYHFYEEGSEKKLANATIRFINESNTRAIEAYVCLQSLFANQFQSPFSVSDKIDSISIEQLNKHACYKSKVLNFRSRKTQWIPQKCKRLLKTNGRDMKSSKRNFILEDPTTSRQVLFVGKFDEGEYKIEIMEPLSIAVGFAIAVCQLDYDS